MANYKVWMRSKAGFYEQYDGFVDVYAKDDSDAISKALRKLKTGAFPDRNNSMWTVEKVERIFR
jgi:hypothetical protein